MIEKPASSAGRTFADPEYTSAEMSEAALIAFIEQRHDQRVREEGRDRPEEEAWEESCRIYNAKKENELRQERYFFHAGQAERLRATLGALVSYHEQEAEKCLDSGQEIG